MYNLEEVDTKFVFFLRLGFLFKAKNKNPTFSQILMVVLIQMSNYAMYFTFLTWKKNVKIHLDNTGKI